MKLRRVCGSALAVLLLAACGPLLIRDDARKEYVRLRSAVLELHRDVDVPPERTRVFFQDGQVQSGLNEFRPHCELTVRNLVDQPQTVYSDRFPVTRVLADTVQVSTAGNVVISVNVDIQLSVGGCVDSGGDIEGRQMKTYIFHLHSDRQPDVLSLVCGGAFDIPALATRPSLQQIEHALGDYPDQHGQQGSLGGQCVCGAIVAQPEIRGGLSQGVQDGCRGAVEYWQLLPVLQS